MPPKSKGLVSVVFLVPLWCANAEQIHTLKGDEVPQYYAVMAFLSEVQDSSEGERADADKLRSLMEEVGVAKCSASTAELDRRFRSNVREAAHP